MELTSTALPGISAAASSTMVSPQVKFESSSATASCTTNRFPLTNLLNLPPLLPSAPVPYVFLASRTAQRWPTIAACWSPRQPAMGTPSSASMPLMVLWRGAGQSGKLCQA